MLSKLDQAIAWKKAHPHDTFRKVAEQFEVPKSTLQDRYTDVHLDHVSGAHGALSRMQEEHLLDKINEYATRGTLLTPRHVKDFAEAICDRQLGVNWTSRFVNRHKDRIHSRYFTFQENVRLKADKRETRKVFYNLIKEVYDSGLYRSDLVFNMDEAPFDLGYERRARRIAPKDIPHNSQGSLPSGEHITSIACIGITAAPVPPLIVYKGKSIQTTWTANDNGVHQLAITSDSGWSNSHIQMVWLRDAFDPATAALARHGQDRRLLFLDGADFHLKAAFLEACRERNITVIVLPAHLTGRFQPLDVDFFNTLKRIYHNQLNNHQVASHAQRVLKGNFWLWHQVAWRDSTTPSQLRSAWRKAGIWPPNRQIFNIETPIPTTPPRYVPDPFPTPQSARMISADKRAVRQNRKPAVPVLHKTQKALEVALTENAFLREENIGLHEVNRQTLAAKGPRQKQNYPEGGLFNNKYHETQAAELEKRKRTEAEASEAKKQKSREGASVHASNSVRPCIPTFLTTVQSLEEIESEGDE